MAERKVDDISYDAFRVEPHEEHIIQMETKRVPAIKEAAEKSPKLSDSSSQNQGKERPARGSKAEKATRGPLGVILRFFNTIVPYGGLLSSAFNLASATLGAGIISLPSAFNLSGIVMSTFYLILVALGTIYSVNLLGKVITKTGLRTYSEAAHHLLGKGAGYGLACLMICLCFGGSVAYIIATSTLLTPVLQTPSAPEYLKTKSGLRLMTAMVWLVLMLPFALSRRINTLRYFSVVGVFFILYFVICIVVHSATKMKKEGVAKDLVYMRTGNDALSGLSLFMFCMMCQMNVFEIFLEMKKRTVFHLTLYTSIGVLFCVVLYFMAGLFGYLDFGKRVTDSVLVLYDPVREPMIAIAYIGIIVKICVAFSLHLIPMRDALYHCMHWDHTTVPYWRHALVTAVPAFLALICGLFIPKVNTVLGLLGSLCGGTIGIIMPALFYMYSGGFSLKEVGLFNYCATYLLLFGGVVAVIFGTGSTIYATAMSSF